jgi:hypothetical protein
MERILLAGLLIIGLTACGGGGESDIPAPAPPIPPNIAPIVTTIDDFSADEGTNVTLNATASDTDGTIASFLWEQVSGVTINLTATDTASASFQAPTISTREISTFRITVTDDDGATASDSVTVAITNVAETFIVPTTSVLPPVVGYQITADIVSMDLNDDGLLDLVSVSTGDDTTGVYQGFAIQALISQGDGSFIDLTETYFPNISSPDINWQEKMYLTDLNNDGRTDIVFHTDNPRGLSPLIRGETSFSFANLPGQDENTGGYVPIDMDADGDTDLLRLGVRNLSSVQQFHEIKLLENVTADDNVLSFLPITAPINDNDFGDLPNASLIYSPIVIDIDLDGFDDLVYTGPRFVSEQGGFVDERMPYYVFRNSGNNTFVDVTESTFPSGVEGMVHARELVAIDANGDGLESIVVIGHGFDKPPFPSEANAILRNQGNGTFIEDEGDTSNFDYLGFTHAVDIEDIDQDGDIDLVFSDLFGAAFDGTNALKVLENDGSGNFTSRNFTDDSALITRQAFTAVLLVDLNNDAFPDLVAGGSSPSSPSRVFYNDGAGNFQVSELP